LSLKHVFFQQTVFIKIKQTIAELRT